MQKNSWAVILLAALAASAAAGTRYSSYTPVRRTFTCDIPADWAPIEEDTPDGSAAHFLGPAEADGAFRAAIHVHFVQKGRPGFIPADVLFKREREANKLTGRTVTSAAMWKLASGRARRFEVTETRQLPVGAIPSRPVILHHYYALAPTGDGYFIIKLSSTRETYLDYRPVFDHLLDTFAIIGYH